MIALLRFLEHREVIIELLFCFERRAVNSLQLRIVFVAFIIRACHVGEFERADVSRAHDVRSGAKIDEVTAAIERDFLVGRNVLNNVEREFAWLWSLAQCGKTSFSSKLERFIARNLHALERMVRLDLLLHLSLDFLEILRRNAVRKIDVVIKPVLYWWPGGELRFRPDF